MTHKLINENIDSKEPISKFDLVIQGGSYVGLSLAVAIKKACPFLKILIIEARNIKDWQHDSRSFAIAAAAIRMLKQLEIWPSIEAQAQPIEEMIITDSRRNDPIRPVFLTFSGEVAPHEPFAYMLETKDLVLALYQEAKTLDIQFCYQHSILNFVNKGSFTEGILTNLSTHTTKNFTTKLLVAADGARSNLRNKAGIKTLFWPYPQMGIVCTIEHERDHKNQAIEHFLPQGPFAILPLKGRRCSLVWNENPDYAQYLIKAEIPVFEQAVEEIFGHHLGKLKLVGKRFAFPFGLRLARNFIQPRFALIGDSAHMIHPISGQGLNLGFRDVALLAEIIVDHARLGLDIGDHHLLELYQRGRRFETVRMGITTDILNRLFSNESEAIRLMRDIGLGLVDKSTSLKDYFIQEASGLTKNAPRLLLGEAL